MSLASGLRAGLRAGFQSGSGPIGTVAATFDTLDLSPQVATATTPWAATLTWQTLGTGGNGKKIEVLFVVTTPSAIEVRDGEGFASGPWTPAPGSVGVMISGDVGDLPTVGALEAAINASSALIQVTTADPSDAKEIDVTLLDTEYLIGTFSGGL